MMHDSRIAQFTLSRCSTACLSALRGKYDQSLPADMQVLNTKLDHVSSGRCGKQTSTTHQPRLVLSPSYRSKVWYSWSEAERTRPWAVHLTRPPCERRARAEVMT